MPNLDDDDRDGVEDAADERENGPWDPDDWTQVVLRVEPGIELELAIEGEAAAAYRLGRTERRDSELTVWIEATRPRRAREAAVLEARARSDGAVLASVRLEVQPFLLPGPSDAISQVLVMDGPRTHSFVGELERSLEGTGVGLYRVAPILDNERDVWLQDAVEIGFFDGSTMRASLEGLRAGNSIDRGGPLDRAMARLLFGPGGGVLDIGEPRVADDWIDQFGNLEVSAPGTSRAGQRFASGRIITGDQNGLRMQAEVLAFLEQQEAQWPPLFLDVGFLLIGHVDEIVHFLPVGDETRVLVASPARALALLESLASQGHGDVPLLEGRRPQALTVSSVLANADLVAFNRRVETRMQKNRELLVDELGHDGEDFIELPVLFEAHEGGALSLWPNLVNGLHVRSRYLAPKPFGPTIDGTDVLEQAVRRALSSAGLTEVHFLDDFEAYSRAGGEIHCATNVLRQPARHRLMQLVRLE